MIGLLNNPLQKEYPADYLLARLAARRGEDFAMLRVPPGQEGRYRAVPAALRQEYRWLYGQLNGCLRQTLAPLFVYFELPALFLLLRIKAGRSTEGRAIAMAESLLAPALQKAARGPTGPAAALRLIDQAWSLRDKTPAGVLTIYAGSGLAAVEEHVMQKLLEGEAQGHSSPALRHFWSMMVDRRNVLALAKRLRWQARRAFGYCTGGMIPVRRLRQAEAMQRPDLLPVFAESLGMAVQQAQWPLEATLDHHVSHGLRQTVAPLDAAGQVVNYMWDAFLAARQSEEMAAGGAGAGWEPGK